jgi:GDP-L-fucose synthase
MTLNSMAASMNKQDKIYIAGHNGMVGSAIKRHLELLGYQNLVYKTSKELDLRNQQIVNEFFASEKPDYVFLAAAKVGGIQANNKYRADFIYENIIVEANVIHAAYVNHTKKLLFLGSSCIYPKLAEQPLKESSLLTGPLEYTNQPYAIAKIAGIEMCNSYRAQYGCNFISVMPTNLYGPNDNYDLENAHVLPSLIRKFIVAKNNHEPEVVIWGTGTPKREFLHVDDLARACCHLMEHYNEPDIINIGCGEDISIYDLALLIKNIVGYTGNITLDSTKPDGTPKKQLCIDKIIQLGWAPTITLEKGISSLIPNLLNEWT